MTPWTPVPPGTRQKKTPSPRPGTRQPCLPGGRDGSRAPFRRAHGKKKTPSPRQGVTPWTPVPPGRSRKTIAVPASRQSSTVLTGGRDGSRAPFRRALTKNNRLPRVPALVNRLCGAAILPSVVVYPTDMRVFSLFNRFSWTKSHSRGRLSQAPHFF